MRALVLCDDTWHPAETARHGLGALGGEFQFEYLADGAAWTAEQMDAFPLTVLVKANITSAQVAQPWLTPANEQAFSEYVRRGHGLAVVHAGLSRYESLPAMHALLGGAFLKHPDPCAVTVEPRSGHPVTHGITPFTVHDEHYFVSVTDPQAEIFLWSRSAHGAQPAGWTRTDGDGRVCVLTPGHNVEAWLHPGYQKLLLNALRWAAKMN